MWRMSFSAARRNCSSPTSVMASSMAASSPGEIGVASRENGADSLSSPSWSNAIPESDNLKRISSMRESSMCSLILASKSCFLNSSSCSQLESATSTYRQRFLRNTGRAAREMPSPTALGQMRNTKLLASRLPHGSFRRTSFRMEANRLGFEKGRLLTRNTLFVNGFGGSPVLEFRNRRHDAIDDLLARLFRVGDGILVV